MKFAVPTFIAACIALTVSCAVENTSQVSAAYKSDRLEQGITFQVAAQSGLNCRDSASISAPITYTLPQNLLVDRVETAKTVSADGYTWLQVNPRSDADHNLCWIAADDQLMFPVVEKGESIVCGHLQSTPDHSILESGGFHIVQNPNRTVSEEADRFLVSGSVDLSNEALVSAIENALQTQSEMLNNICIRGTITSEDGIASMSEVTSADGISIADYVDQSGI